MSAEAVGAGWMVLGVLSVAVWVAAVGGLIALGLWWLVRRREVRE